MSANGSKTMVSWSAEVIPPTDDCSFVTNVSDLFVVSQVDGKLLLQIDQKFAKETIGLTNKMLIRKLCRQVEDLKKAYFDQLKVTCPVLPCVDMPPLPSPFTLLTTRCDTAGESCGRIG